MSIILDAEQEKRFHMSGDVSPKNVANKASPCRIAMGIKKQL